MTDIVENRVQRLLSRLSGEDKELITTAGEIIRAGGLVAFPTETVYGLGANALDPTAVTKTYKAKGRPSDNPLILHVCSIEMTEQIVEINQNARLLMKKFWPGPLTLVLPAKEIVPLETRGGLPTAAVRMPDGSFALGLIKAAGVPISGPSANKSGRPSPTDAQTVKNDLGDFVDMVLDGGQTRIGVESTVIDVTGQNPVLLRAGGTPKEKIEEAVGVEVLFPQDQNIIKRSPGTRYRHYAPKIPLVLSTAQDAGKNGAGRKWTWIGISEPAGEPFQKIIYNNENEYAKELFKVLRIIEASGAELIVAEIPSGRGIGPALKDRLVRASGG